MKKLSAFSLIEVVMIIVIIGILAVIALPRFISFRDSARKAAEEATIGAVQSGINISSAVEEARR